LQCLNSTLWRCLMPVDLPIVSAMSLSACTVHRQPIRPRACRQSAALSAHQQSRLFDSRTDDTKARSTRKSDAEHCGDVCSVLRSASDRRSACVARSRRWASRDEGEALLDDLRARKERRRGASHCFRGRLRNDSTLCRDTRRGSLRIDCNSIKRDSNSLVVLCVCVLALNRHSQRDRRRTSGC
jgi:hypothetical protein